MAVSPVRSSTKLSPSVGAYAMISIKDRAARVCPSLFIPRTSSPRRIGRRQSHYLQRIRSTRRLGNHARLIVHGHRSRQSDFKAAKRNAHPVILRAQQPHDGRSSVSQQLAPSRNRIGRPTGSGGPADSRTRDGPGKLSRHARAAKLMLGQRSTESRGHHPRRHKEREVLARCVDGSAMGGGRR